LRIKARRDAQNSAAQLGYAVIGPREYKDFDPYEYEIRNFGDLFGPGTHLKGGMDFDNQAKRYVLAFRQLIGGKRLFVFHSNASAKSQHILPWVIESIRVECNGKPWALVGDLNCEPTELATGIQIFAKYYKNNEWSAGFHRAFDGETYHAKGYVNRKGKKIARNLRTLDYAVCPQNAQVRVNVFDSYLHTKQCCKSWGVDYEFHPDHLPILVGL
jgi:hypothetical protein